VEGSNKKEASASQCDDGTGAAISAGGDTAAVALRDMDASSKAGEVGVARSKYRGEGEGDAAAAAAAATGAGAAAAAAAAVPK